jgi:hypothetical protein
MRDGGKEEDREERTAETRTGREKGEGMGVQKRRGWKRAGREGEVKMI